MMYAFENILHLKPIHIELEIEDLFTKVSFFHFKGNDSLPRVQMAIVMERNDEIIYLCEAKFVNTKFILNKEIKQALRRKRLVFQEITKTKKNGGYNSF